MSVYESYTNEYMSEGPGDRSGDRKERVIHTRVAEDLDDEIKRRAQSLGVSVSNLVRNILQNTVGLVEDILQDGADAARAARTTPRPPEPPQSTRAAAAPRVLGFQSAVLAVNAVCERCNAILPRGTRAGVAILDAPGPPLFRCDACVAALEHDAPVRPPGE